MQLNLPLHTMRVRPHMSTLLICLAFLCLQSAQAETTRASADATTPISVLLCEDESSEPPGTASAAATHAAQYIDADSMHDGFWIVSSEPSAQLPEADRPRFAVAVRRYDSATGLAASSLSELQHEIDPAIPICVMVHGSFMGERFVKSEAMKTWNWMKQGAQGRPFQMIYFRWPSDRPLGPLVAIDVAVLGRRASWNGFYLNAFLHSLPENARIGLIGHSHGSRVIGSALHLMGGGRIDGLQSRHQKHADQRIRTVFTASAIDHHWLNPGEEFGCALGRTEGLLNLTNTQDPALLVFPLRCKGIRRALGRTGLTDEDRQELGALAGRVRDLDVADYVGCRHMWPAWTEHSALAVCAMSWLMIDED